MFKNSPVVDLLTDLLSNCLVLIHRLLLLAIPNTQNMLFKLYVLKDLRDMATFRLCDILIIMSLKMLLI